MDNSDGYPGNGPETSSGLLRELGNNVDSARWTEFVRLYIPLFRMWLASWHRTHPMLESSLDDDVIQETLVFLMKEFPSFQYDRGKGRFRGYLYRVLNLKLLKEMENLRIIGASKVRFNSEVADLVGEQLPKTNDEDPVAEQLDIQKEIWDIIIRRVFSGGKFSKQSQAVFKLAVAGELSAAEIGERYDMKANAVYQVKARVLEAAKKELARMKRGGDDLFGLLDKLLAEEMENGQKA